MFLPNRGRQALPWYAISTLAVAWLSGCGGGDGGNGPGPDPDPVVVLLTPGRDTINIGGSLQFQASVTGSSNTGITWSLKEGTTAGTISANGNYVAGGNGGLFTIIATSQADPASSDTSRVLVVPLPAATITAPDSVLQGSTGLSATVAAQEGTFLWTITGGTLTAGSTTRTVTFTAGASGVVQLQCVVTNLAGTAAAGNSATVTVAPPVVISWTADRDTITDGETATLSPVFEGGTGSVNQGIGPVVSGTSIQTSTIQFSSTTFTLIVTGFRGAITSANVTVVPVDPPLIFSFESIARSVAFGDSAILRLVYLNDAGVTATVDHGVGMVSSGTFFTAPIFSPTLFTATVANAADSAITDTVTAFSEAPAPGSFTTIGTLQDGRQWHTVTVLGNGRVLIAGGVDGSGQERVDAVVLDPATGIASPTGPMTVGRANHQAVLLPNGRVLVSGGVVGGNSASAELYDPISGTFTTAGNMVKARFNHTMTLLQDGRVLIIGGDIISRQAELYDPIAGTFTVTDTMLGPRTKFTAILLQDGRVLVIGAGTSTEIYEPVSGQFSAGPSLALDHTDGSFTLLADGRVLAVGGVGSDGIKPQPQAELMDVALNSVVSAGQMALARMNHVASLRADGTVLIAGGGQLNFPLGVIGASEVFDPVQGKFLPADHMAEPRNRHRAVALPGGAILVIGGSSLSGPVLTVERFQ